MKVNNTDIASRNPVSELILRFFISYQIFSSSTFLHFPSNKYPLKFLIEDDEYTLKIYAHDVTEQMVQR
jgi:hypothetical protein